MSADKPKPVLMVTGVTACGKTSRAVTLARALGGEIVSADSRQVYRGMDIGTGKDLGEYGDVPVHVLDVVPAGYRYNLYEYLRDARACIDDIEFRGHLPIVCGGTGLYVESLARGTRLPEVPENPDLRKSLEGKSLAELTEILAGMKRLHNTTDVDTAKRAIRAIEIETYYAEHPELAAAVKGNGDDRRYAIICLDIDRESRRERISRRLRSRLDDGMLDEARRLMAEGVDADTMLYYGLEYKFMALHLTGALSYDEMVSGLETAIHQFAKRQATWFRGMERRGFTLHHVPYDIPDVDLIAEAKSLL
ncbi:MAG: tRNA (adenosine(37)-N6)-dimethylallyltransferase MiaA [Muribaculaceae bacterium]